MNEKRKHKVLLAKY